MEDLAHEQYLNVVIYSKAYKYSITEEIETYLTVILSTVVAYTTLSLVVFICTSGDVCSKQYEWSSLLSDDSHFVLCLLSVSFFAVLTAFFIFFQS